ncbi:unnamed protein product, partial [Meganyctiphanes norvegica]
TSATLTVNQNMWHDASLAYDAIHTRMKFEAIVTTNRPIVGAFGMTQITNVSFSSSPNSYWLTCSPNNLDVTEMPKPDRTKLIIAAIVVTLLILVLFIIIVHLSNKRKNERNLSQRDVSGGDPDRSANSGGGRLARAGRSVRQVFIIYRFMSL